MRTIKFRGLKINNKEWVYGGISVFENDTTIFDCNCMVNSAYEVFGYSVGQFTGLKDKNVKDIYECDILKNPKGEIGKVIWFEAGFHLECKRKNGDLFMIPLTAGFLGNKEIIGNQFDNPELLS